MENFNKQQTRDYDKEPIILKNYEYLYQKLLMVFSFFIGGVFAIIVNFDWKASSAANYSANDGICMILFLSFLSLFIILPELIDYKKERPTIRLKNNQTHHQSQFQRLIIAPRRPQHPNK